MATIADIVNETGLARTTVAEILRNKPGYNDKTRERVQQAAKKLNYRPNFLSKALSGGKSMTIGVLAASLETASANSRLFAIESAAREAGYLAYVIGWGDNDGNGLKQYLQDLLDRRVDGLVIYRDIPFRHDVEKMLAGLSIPVVYIDSPPTEKDVAVHLPREKANNAMAEHLADLGHKRAAYVLSQYHYKNPQRRATMLQKAFSRVGIALDPLEDWLMPPGHHNAQQISEIYLDMFKDRDLPTAILANGDEYALAMIYVLRKFGYEVPRDISVVGFDDMPLSTLVQPAITTVKLPGPEVGRRAFELLYQKLQAPDEPVKSDVFSCEFIPRESTGPAPSK